jgi:zinc/manganese transport system permease protein
LILAALAVFVISRKQLLFNDAFFYAVFAVIASLAVPALGLFLVFASLIAPALWIERGLKPWLAMLLASLFCLIGLILSWVVDAPSGPSVVMTLAGFGVCALFRQQTQDPESIDHFH